MRKCKCYSNSCLHERKTSVDKLDDFLSAKNGITINNDNRSPDFSKTNRSRSVSPPKSKKDYHYRSRSHSKNRSRSRSHSRSRSKSPLGSRKRKKHSKRACKHIMFKTAKALCNPELRKKYAKIIVKKKKKCKK